jgi:hypothetical protein
MPNPEIDGSIIVLRGSFNPKIVQPAWLARQGLIREEEAEAATIQVMTHDVAIVNFEWLEINITEDRFSAVCKDPARHLPLRDLVASIFELLGHTPIRQLGINRQLHIPIEREEDWHRIGHTLAPKDAWSGLLDEPIGMLSLTIEGQRAASAAKYIRAKVEPSKRVKPYGILIDFNAHYESETELPSSESPLLPWLRSEWEARHRDSLEIAMGIIERSLRRSADA